MIECNARAAIALSLYFKVVNANLAMCATDIMLGKTPDIKYRAEDSLMNVGVKAAMFSFSRLKVQILLLG